MKYRALAFFDLDGTLLDDKSQITPEISEAMAKLKENNVLPIIATGRSENELQAIKAATGITSNIVMNGSVIRIEDKIVYEETYDLAICERMIEAVHKNRQEVAFYNLNQIWASGHSADLDRAFQFIHSQTPPILPTNYQTDTVNMLLILGQTADEFYHEQFPELTFYRNTPYSIDVVYNGTSKGAAVKRFQELMGALDVPTYGFGDGPNDIPLLAACDYKIAMGNAKPELKEMANFVTKKNTEGGILHALKHFNLL